MPLDQLVLETARPDYSRLDDYFGLWSIYEPAFNGLFDLVARTDLNQHVAAAAIKRVESSSNPAPYQVTADGVAIIPIRGSLMKAQSSMISSTSTVEARSWVRAAKNDPNVLAVCFVFDSPGGTVAGTHDLANDIASLGKIKPTAGFCEDMAASACYWLASQCHVIACGPTAIVGSIGTFLAVNDLSARAEDMKIKVHVVKAGQFKGAGVPGTPVTQEQLAEWQRMVNSLNEQFVASALVTGRKMTAEQSALVADGRVHVGAEAKAMGLVDAVQSLDETIQQLVERAGGGSSKNKESKMSDQDTAPKAATLPELKAACVGASNDFLMAQLEAGVTVAVAQGNYLVATRAENERLRAEAEKAKADQASALEAASAAKKELEETQASGGKKRGVEPFETDKSGKAADSGFDGDPVAEFNARRDKLIAEGKSPFHAAAMIAKSDPQLHVAYQLATNSKKNAKALVRDMAETYDIAG